MFILWAPQIYLQNKIDKKFFCHEYQILVLRCLYSETLVIENYLHFSIFGIARAKQRTIRSVSGVIFTHPFLTKSSGPTVFNEKTLERNWNSVVNFIYANSNYLIYIQLQLRLLELLFSYLYRSKSHQLDHTFLHFYIGKSCDKHCPIYHKDIVLGTEIQ